MDNKRKLSSRKASFLKVIEDDATKKLPIPRSFSKIFEGDIRPWFILEIAGTRKCWRVDIEEDGNGGLYLGCGFECFVEAESLEVGNFLLFELQEPSILQVKIYEKDGSEKTEGTTFESVLGVGASESPKRTPKIHQERETSPWPTIPCDPIPCEPIPCEPIPCESTPYEPIPYEPRPCEPISYDRYETSENPQTDVGGIKRKKGIVSPTEHGLCFSMTWKKANHFIYYLTIPKAMLTGKTFSNKEALILKDREGKSWPVELRMRPDGRVDLARGWREFVNGSDLTTGDTLSLEFVSNNVIQVHVERPSRADNSSQIEQECKIEPPESFNMACENVEPAANCTVLNSAPVIMPNFERVASELKSSTFSVTFTQRTRINHLHIPKAIANRQKLEHKDQVVLCDPEGRQWLMEVRTRQSDGRVGLGRGWADFVKSYGIGIGDTLVFEFVADRMMKVHVIKAFDSGRGSVTAGMFKQEILKLP